MTAGTLLLGASAAHAAVVGPLASWLAVAGQTANPVPNAGRGAAANLATDDTRGLGGTSAKGGGRYYGIYGSLHGAAGESFGVTTAATWCVRFTNNDTFAPNAVLFGTAFRDDGSWNPPYIGILCSCQGGRCYVGIAVSDGAGGGTYTFAGGDAGMGLANGDHALHTIVGTWDGNNLKCFQDGVQNGSTVNVAGDPKAIAFGAGDWFLGARSYTSLEPLGGWIEGPAFLDNRVYSELEIAAL